MLLPISALGSLTDPYKKYHWEPKIKLLGNFKSLFGPCSVFLSINITAGNFGDISAIFEKSREYLAKNCKNYRKIFSLLLPRQYFLENNLRHCGKVNDIFKMH